GTARPTLARLPRSGNRIRLWNLLLAISLGRGGPQALRRHIFLLGEFRQDRQPQRRGAYQVAGLQSQHGPGPGIWRSDRRSLTGQQGRAGFFRWLLSVVEAECTGVRN